MPYALHAIMPPGGLVAGYQRGHEIHASVIENWGLVEGQDWSADHPDHTEQAPVAAAPRPVDDGDRAAWVAYAISRGTPAIDAEGMDLPVLMDLYPEEDESAAEDADRPADSAKKAEWVRYVSSHPQADDRSEERRVGKECRSRWSPYH